MVARGLVDAPGVRPDPEVANVQDVIEAHAEVRLEREDVEVEPIDGSVDVPSGAEDHRRRCVVRDLRRSPDAYRMCEVVVKVENIVDLTEPSIRESYGVDREQLRAWTSTPSVAEHAGMG